MILLQNKGWANEINLPNKRNLNEYSDIGYHWIDLYSLNNNVTYFDSFGVEHIPKEIKKIIAKKIQINLFRIQAFDSLMCGSFCILFSDFMLADKHLNDFTNFFSPNNFKKTLCNQ